MCAGGNSTFHNFWSLLLLAMSSLKDRLLSAEDDYLTALISGEDAMIAFEIHWEAILAEIDAAYESTGLDSSTITLAHTTSLRIATLADTSIELFDSYNSITSQLMVQLDHCMYALTLDDSSERPQRGCHLSPSHPSLPSLSSAEHGASNPRKRRSASIEEIVKRPRLNIDVVAYPTKKSRRDGPPLTSIAPTTIPDLERSVVPTPSVTRKRRLSDTASPPLVGAKRLCAGPRLHAVSDTYATIYSSKGHTSIPTSPVQAATHGPSAQPAIPIYPVTLDPVTLDVHSLPCTGSPGGSDVGELFATAPLNVLPPGDSDLDVFLDSSFLSFGPSSTTLASPILHPASAQVLESLLSSELYSDLPDQAGSPCDTSTTASSPSPPPTPRFSSPTPYGHPKNEVTGCDVYEGVDISSMFRAVSDTDGISPVVIAPNVDPDRHQVSQPDLPDSINVVYTDGAATNPFDLWQAPSQPLCWTSSPCDTSEVLKVFGVGLPLGQAVDRFGKPDFREAVPSSDMGPTIFTESVPEGTASVSMPGAVPPWNSYSLSYLLPFTVDILSAA
ncbi:hypothetical protein V8D89_012373 [Ganoderma adspersum]